MSDVKHITSSEAFEILREEENAHLIDVRTLPEWNFVGLPNLNDLDKDVYRISWLFYPTMEVNQEFIAQLADVTANKNDAMIFLCKVGGRSTSAANAALKSGYSNCYNIADGFEGSSNELGQRGKVDGWKASGLPWFQS